MLLKHTWAAKKAGCAEKILLFGADLCCKLIQLLQCDLVCSEDGRDDFSSTRRQHVTVGVGDLLNETVRAEHSQQTGNACRAPLLGLGAVWGIIE